MTIYDYDEAAAALRVEKSWLQRHIKELPHSKKGRVVTFTDADLERIDQMHHHEPSYGPLAKPAPAPAVAGVHPLAALKPLPARKRAS
ncbi:helix-turn-helix domain-containing protein [Streptomyces sp. NRRL F-5123]|uniref:helix-turn-helix domain-containing protein n=1 Tax=Streptomyces sp. NRRL F-5123 TaxID=1463856 RepID=UPI0004E1E0D9|nr:helix-turn-helix domain-containing protein [Streptomyces sp. NRRL F-5123]